MKNLFEISRISLFPERGTPSLFLFDSSQFKNTKNKKAQLCARVEVVLNDILVLRGLKILHGSFGYYVSFPHSSKGIAYKFYEATSMKFRQFLEQEVLAEFFKKCEMSSYIHSNVVQLPRAYYEEAVC